MCQASWSGKNETPARSAVRERRAFFVPSAKCQARVLECQALDLKTLGAGGSGLGGSGLGGLIYWFLCAFTSSLEPRASSKRWWR